jgi:hypothetical protein
MAVVDGHQPGIRNEACQDAAIGDRHERIVGRLLILGQRNLMMYAPTKFSEESDTVGGSKSFVLSCSQSGTTQVTKAHA